jgi:Large polyvalent protein-associated domain 7
MPNDRQDPPLNTEPPPNAISQGKTKEIEVERAANALSTDEPVRAIAKKKPGLFQQLAERLMPSDELIIPVEVAQRYIKVKDDYVDRNTQAVAFTVSKGEVVAKDTHPNTVKALVEIAKSNEWQSITVSGTDEFKAAVWMAARTQGLEVYGYKPTPVEEARLAEVIELKADKPRDVTQQVRPDGPVGAVAQGPAKQIAPEPPMPKLDAATKDLAAKDLKPVAVNALSIKTLQAAMKAKGWPPKTIEEFGRLAKDKAASLVSKPIKVRDVSKAPQRPAPVQQKAPSRVR